ncbi:glycosyltransferase [Acinetobacter genomosp. 15BJ]|uniref:Glycosyltransferase n=1 Tax=Acinetobacter genomosp. 15BJ TaxID=106651 RepID=A0ABT8V2U0_9GAMM|nr:glycosyltransferase [Acinetobacter genomosp. 15BJ]MDO3658219.1 glycosyltransferase [Acinetobacter genomosp. 15BJ]
MNFSVLMSLYYKENVIFLDECFKSIWLNQAVKPNEIVLILDGSVGEELQNCVQYWGNQIGPILKVIPLPHNVGLGKALNEGIKHCSNEWIFRMDTDDICTADRFEKQVAFIQQHPDVVLFSGQVMEFDQNISDANVLKAVPVTYEEIKEFAKKRCPFNHMAVAYKRNVILGLGGYQHHLFMEDYNLWLRVIGNNYRVANLPDVLLYARVGNGMHARRKGLEYIKSEKQLLDLKKQLKLQNPVYANMLFLVRSAFRLLPADVLGKIYNTFLRKSIKK